MLKDRRKYKVKYITDKKGNRKEVILNINEYNELIEDLEDLAIAANRKKEKLVEHEDVIIQLQKDGLL